jgi:hypothetical protein
MVPVHGLAPFGYADKRRCARAMSHLLLLLDLMVQGQSTSIMVHLEIHPLDRLADVSRLRDLSFVSSFSHVPAGRQHYRDGVEDVLNSPARL